MAAAVTLLALVAATGCTAAPSRRAEAHQLAAALKRQPGVWDVKITYENRVSLRNGEIAFLAVDVAMPYATDAQVMTVAYTLNQAVDKDFAEFYHPMTISIGYQTSLNAMRFYPDLTTWCLRVARQLIRANLKARSIKIGQSLAVLDVDIFRPEDSDRAVRVAARVIGARTATLVVDPFGLAPVPDDRIGEVSWRIQTPLTQTQLDRILAEIRAEPNPIAAEVRDGRLTRLQTRKPR
ncbi:hypothetical protein [Mycolicibacterium palauense]|uniref:hypothetical protein n=1 Tax=Mycolicibacterium palauense TaxID=2034511 RepID=UPI001145BC96|nr:hypothetical protein [Mycolicibacterium palauense]